MFCFFSYGICAQPVINSLSPLSGSTGSTVTISGSNFDPVAANNIVYFGAVKANIISASATVLTVSVPAGASYEPVTVTTSTLTAISAKPFTVTFGCAASANLSASSFVRYTINDGGNYSIMNADMDGEGKPDIICSNGSSIIILLNKSTLNTVSFASGKIIAAKCCFKFDIADVDGDGKLDLIIPNVCNNLVSIMKNNSATGSLSFASAMDYVTGDYPYAVAVSNIDGDGKPDLAVVNMEGNTLSVFRNASTNGVISFVNKIDYPTGAECRDVAIADIDGDGKQDIAVTSQSDQYFSLFKNLSTANTIVLSAKQDFSTSPSNPEDIAIADFDGDGKSDIAVSNNNTAGNISVFKNLSIPGSFSFAPRKDFLTGAYPFRMAAADLNGDGRPDLAVKDQYTSTLTLLENNSSTGNISFASKIDLPARSPERQHLTVGDFNGDGKPEIAVTDGTNIFIFLNPAILSISASYTIPTCSEYDGTITAIALGGQAPYEYKIGTLPYQGSGNFTKLPPGTHLVRVKDASGCVDSLTVVLPSNYLWFTTSVRDANCNQNNGSISISGGGTNLPLTYSLNGINFQSTPQFNNLAPGIYNVYVKDNGGCMNQTGFTIGSRCMTITPTVTKTTCGFGNGIIEVQASGGVSPYQYSLDGVQYVSNNRFTNLTPKDYTVYVKDASGNTASGTVTVSNIAGPILSAVDITSTDCNSNTGTATIIPQGGSAPFQYVLNAVTFQSNPTFSSLAPGSYKLTVNDANGCFDSRTIEIPVNNNLTIDMGQDLTVCETAKVTFAGRSNGTSFSWSPSTALNSSSILSPVASPSTTTTYIVTASLGACTSKDTIIVNLRPAPVPNAGTDITICPGQTTVLKGSGGISYSWSPSLYLSDASSSTPVFSGASKGNYVYSLNVTDANGCHSVKPATIKLSVLTPLIDAGRDTVVLVNLPVQLNAKDPGNYGFVQYSWTPVTGLNNPSIANPVVIADRDIIYTVTAQTQNGCIGTDSISIKVYNRIDIYVPTAFTPNNDRKNDILKAIPVGIKDFKYLEIYNRWGQLVFRTRDASRGWDGKLNGLLQTGVVVWVAEGVDYNGQLVRRKGTTAIVQ